MWMLFVLVFGPSFDVWLFEVVGMPYITCNQVSLIDKQMVEFYLLSTVPIQTFDLFPKVWYIVCTDSSFLG